MTDTHTSDTQTAAAIASARGTETALAGPAPQPCSSCPYRRDVPSGIWAPSEYRKLPAYDQPTWNQPTAPFQCHQNAAGDDRARLCSGWVGCHGTELLALRLAAAARRLSGPALDATITYTSPVPLFESGSAAMEHGMRDIVNPGPAAVKAIAKIRRRRPDMTPAR